LRSPKPSGSKIGFVGSFANNDTIKEYIGELGPILNVGPCANIITISGKINKKVKCNLIGIPMSVPTCIDVRILSFTNLLIIYIYYFFA